MKIDASDPGCAALVMFAAAWLHSRTSEMNAENAERQANGYASAYGDAAFTSAQREAVTLAQTGTLPEWVSSTSPQEPT